MKADVTMIACTSGDIVWMNRLTLMFDDSEPRTDSSLAPRVSKVVLIGRPSLRASANHLDNVRIARRPPVNIIRRPVCSDPSRLVSQRISTRERGSYC